MKRHPLSLYRIQSRQPPGPSGLAADIDRSGEAAAISRKAYFSYVDQGSQSGNDVRHWLEAESALGMQHSGGRLARHL